MLHRDRMKVIIMFLTQWTAFDDSVSRWAHTGPQTGRWGGYLAWWGKTTAARTPSVSGSTEFHFSELQSSSLPLNCLLFCVELLQRQPGRANNCVCAGSL